MSRPVVSRTTSCTQLLWNPRDTSKEGAPFYLVTFENWLPMGQGKLHVRMYVCMYVCMYVYYTVVLVPGEPLRRYRGSPN
jgi:hypothetical protein